MKRLAAVLVLCLTALSLAATPAAAQRQRLSMDPGWRFTLGAPAGGRGGYFPIGIGWYRKAFRLPTGAEWERAARCGETAWPPGPDAGNFADLQFAELVGRHKRDDIRNHDDGHAVAAPVGFGSVGQWYGDFSPVEDATVLAILDESRAS